MGVGEEARQDKDGEKRRVNEGERAGGGGRIRENIIESEESQWWRRVQR